MPNIFAGDLFCGAGGFSQGLIEACRGLSLNPELLAVNHWPKAIATHKLNHPEVSHLCENLDNVDPRKVITSGRLNMMLASPECTHHSRARGGKPMSDQSRASAWHVVRWCEALRVDSVIVENVKEFEEWGPLDRHGKPIKHRKGEIFRAWLQCLESLGYHVDKRVLNSAHYGAATSRERLFIQACRRRKPRWPDRTNSDSTSLFDNLPPYRAARDIIDWSLEGRSIFGRKKALSDKTLARIMAGLKKFGGADFLLPHQHGSSGLGNVRSLERPLPTITGTSSDMFLAAPFIVVLRNNCDARSVDRPLPALCAGAEHFALCEPFIVPVTHGGGEDRAYGIDKPLPTVTTAQRGEMALIEPFLVRFNDGIDRRVHSLDKPLGTLDTSNRYGLAEPYLVKYYGTGNGAASCDNPLPTVTTNDRFGLCEPEPVAVFERDGVTYALLDIRFRMLQPHELAAAMGMPGYQFAGNKGDSVRMIGNAVEVNTSRALCATALQDYAQ